MGIVANLTRRARELVCMAGIGCGFAQAVKRLARFCGWSVSTQTMRRTCEREGLQIEAWREGKETPAPALAEHTIPDLDGAANQPVFGPLAAPAPAEESMVEGASARPPAPAARRFREAEGFVEFSTDGTSVNTLDGWRELRIALWLKRPAGPSAEPYEWGVRSLPKPTARTVLIDIASSDAFAARWRAWLADLGINEPATVAVLADGAEWIWKQTAIQFPGATGVLDVFHVREHIAQAVREMFGDNSGAALAWSNAGGHWLLQEGWSGLCRWTAAVREECLQSNKAVLATENLIGYLSKHVPHLNYRQRLKEGTSIGSGAVEGAAKQLVGQRLKQTGARWKPENAIALATLVSAEWAGDWDLYWHPNPQDAQFPLALVA